MPVPESTQNMSGTLSKNMEGFILVYFKRAFQNIVEQFFQNNEQTLNMLFVEKIWIHIVV